MTVFYPMPTINMQRDILIGAAVIGGGALLLSLVFGIGGGGGGGGGGDKTQIAKCRQKLEKLIASLPGGGSDVVSQFESFNADYPCNVFDRDGQPNAEAANRLYNLIPCGFACEALKEELPYDLILFDERRPCPKCR